MAARSGELRTTTGFCPTRSATSPPTTRELKDGDRLRFGDFEVLVSIDASNDFPPDKSAIIAYDGRGTPGSAVAKSTQNDLGEALDLDSLLASDHNGESGSPYGPVDAYGQPIKSPGKRSLKANARKGVKSLLDDNTELVTPGKSDAAGAKPWHLSTRPVNAAKPGPQAKPSTAQESPSSV